MGVVSVTVPPIGFPPAAGASRIVDLTDVDAGAAGSAVGRFLTEIAPVSGARRFAFLPAAGGLKVADWDASGEPMPLDPVAVGGTLATIEGVATLSPFDPVSVMDGAAIFYGLTMPVGLPADSAALNLVWPVLPSDVPAYVLTLLHDQSANLTDLVESVLSSGAVGASGLIAGIESGNGFGFTLPNNDSFPLTLPESGQSIVLTVDSSGSLVFSGFGDDILTDAAANSGYAVSYLMLIMGVSESLPSLSIDLASSDLGGGDAPAELPADASDLDTIYRVTHGGTYADQVLKQNDHVIFYNDQADFLIIRLPVDFNPDDVADLIANAIAASVQTGGVVDGAINTKLQASVQTGGVVDGAINTKLQASVQTGGVVDGAINTKLSQSVQAGGVVDSAILQKTLQGLSIPSTKVTINESDTILGALQKLQASILFTPVVERQFLPNGGLVSTGNAGTPALFMGNDGILYLRGLFRRPSGSPALSSGDFLLFSMPVFGSGQSGLSICPFNFEAKAIDFVIDDPASIQFNKGSNIKLRVLKPAFASEIEVRMQGDFAAGSTDIFVAAKLGMGYKF